MKISRRHLKRLIETYIQEGEVIPFPGMTEPVEDEDVDAQPGLDLGGDALERLAVERGTMIQKPDGTYEPNPEFLESLGNEPPYDTLMGVAGRDQGLIGDIEVFGPYEYTINISRARGPVDTAELKGVWTTDDDVSQVIDKLIYGGGLLGDITFRSLKFPDEGRTVRKHIGFDEYPDEERDFYETFGDHYPEDVLNNLDSLQPVEPDLE